MIMRKKPLRGEKYIVEGAEVTVLEVKRDGVGNMVSVIFPSGKTGAVAKSQLNLAIIDTQDYEKI
jgi:hypothetical protein